MKLLIVLTICVACQAGVIPGSITLVGHGGAIVQGPSSATNLLGPDGSAISASAIGGRVAAHPTAAVASAWGPIVAGHGYFGGFY